MAEEERKTYTALDLAIDVIRAMDTLEDTVCMHPSLPREVGEKCVELCKKLKEGALRYLESLRFRGRRRTWTISKGGLKG